MKLGTGKILEIRQSPGGFRQAVIQLFGTTRPAPGQYLQAYQTEDLAQPAGITLFTSGLPGEPLLDDRFLTAPGIPLTWQPGDFLRIRGPLGRGFSLPPDLSKLALCTFGQVSDHLLPLAGEVLANGGEVAVYLEGNFSQLPAQIEISQREDLPEIFRWADMIACAIPLETVYTGLDQLYQLSPFSCPVQVLIYSQFPCQGLAECGICAFQTKTRRTIFVCHDGPVFDWHQIS